MSPSRGWKTWGDEWGCGRCIPKKMPRLPLNQLYRARRCIVSSFDNRWGFQTSLDRHHHAESKCGGNVLQISKDCDGRWPTSTSRRLRYSGFDIWSALGIWNTVHLAPSYLRNVISVLSAAWSTDNMVPKFL